MRFTKQAIEALPLPPKNSKPAFYWDDALKGFGVKLNPGGSRQFIAQYRTRDGRERRTTIGPVGTVNLDAARREARIILAKAQTGFDPQAEKIAARKQAAVTLGVVRDRYLERAKERLKLRSYQEVERHLKKDWQPLAALPLAGITRKDVAAHLNVLALGSGGRSRKVAATRARAALSTMFTWAMGEGLADTNPVVGTNKPAEERSRERVLTASEMKAIWHEAGSDDYGVIVKLLILTAQRRDEVGAMADEELNLASDIWTIPGGKVADGRTTKNKRPQEVPLSPMALSLISTKPRIADRTMVFGRGRKGFSGWSACKARLDKRLADGDFAMTAPWRLHDLRRTAATMMAEHLAVPPHIIEVIENRVSGFRAGPAGVYNRAHYRAEKRDALDRWAEYVSRITS